MKSRRVLLILFIGISLVLSVLSCSEQKKNSFLFSDKDCQAPCWNSIMPGISTRSQATSMVAELTDIENLSSTDTDLYFKYKSQRVHLVFDGATQIVEMIIYELDDSSLGEIVENFGEPESLSFMMDGAWTVLIQYPKTGRYFDGPCKTTSFGNAWRVSPNTKITQGILLSPTMDDMQRNHLLFGDASERIKDGFIEWDGFKNYPFELQQ